MSNQQIYHFSKEGRLHDGHSWDCVACAKARSKKTRKEKCKVGGSSGGKKAAAKVHAARECSCGAKIHRDNKSGLCIKCLNKNRKVKKKPSLAPRVCSTRGCSSKLGIGNKTGLCAKCFRKSEHWRRQQEEHSNWITSAIFHKDVKPIPSVGSSEGWSDAEHA